jgi:hypothetical protein
LGLKPYDSALQVWQGAQDARKRTQRIVIPREKRHGTLPLQNSASLCKWAAYPLV